MIETIDEYKSRAVKRAECHIKPNKLNAFNSMIEMPFRIDRTVNNISNAIDMIMYMYFLSGCGWITVHMICNVALQVKLAPTTAYSNSMCMYWWCNSNTICANSCSTCDKQLRFQSICLTGPIENIYWLFDEYMSEWHERMQSMRPPNGTEFYFFFFSKISSFILSTINWPDWNLHLWCGSII